MGGADSPRLVPLLDLVNHDAGRAPFTSFDAPAANVAVRLEARRRRADETTAEFARTGAAAARRAVDGEDWCLWSYDEDHATPRSLEAGDEVLASYLNADYSRAEWFANTGFVPPGSS